MGFLDDFTGASAQKDLKRGRTAQRNELMAGYDTAGGQLEEGYNTARGYIDPYVQGGQRYQGMYDDLMGLNGDEARTRAQGVITSDPLWSGALGQSSNAAQRALNARGLGGSGTAALAGQRVLLENYQPMLNRYQQGGQQGMQAAGMGADLASRYGSERANLSYGNAQQLAGVEGNYATGMAASRSTLTNNLLGVAGTVMAGFTPGFGGATAFGNMGSAVNKLWGAGAGNTGGVLPGGRPLGQGGIGAR